MDNPIEIKKYEVATIRVSKIILIERINNIKLL